MKGLQLLFIFLVSLLITSCTHYQYVTLESDLQEDKDTQRYYKVEDDVKITYGFSDENMSIQTIVSNESDTADLFIDLESSVYIDNGEVIGVVYNGKELDFIGESTTYDYEDNTIFSDEGSVTRGRGRVSGNPSIIFVPPGAYAEFTSSPFEVDYDKIKRKNYSTEVFLQDDGKSRKVTRYDFGKDARNFGISFRVARDVHFESPWSIHSDFREAHLYNSKTSLTHVPEGENKQYVTKEVKGGTVAVFMIGAAGAFLLGVGLAAAGVDLDDEESQE